MGGFTRAELEAYRGASVDDLVDAGTRLLFVGINPGLWTAATNTHFCHPSNRFYPALREGGLIDWELDAKQGMSSAQRQSLLDAGIGITNLVNRATARASELTSEELRQGGRRLTALMEGLQPTVAAIAGVTAFRSAFRQPKAVLGEQPETWGDVRLWIVPNPSGLNAHETVQTLASHYRRVAEEAGIL